MCDWHAAFTLRGTHVWRTREEMSNEAFCSWAWLLAGSWMFAGAALAKRLAREHRDRRRQWPGISRISRERARWRAAFLPAGGEGCALPGPRAQHHRRTARARHRGRRPQHHQRQPSRSSRVPSPCTCSTPYGTQDYAGWRANLDAINEFYFTDWSDSYAEAFGDRSARGVIAVAVYGEVPPPRPVYQPYRRTRAQRRFGRRAGRAARRRPKNPRVAAMNPPAPVMAIGASITPCRWSSSRGQTPTAVTSSSTNGVTRCAASISSSAARRIDSGMNPRWASRRRLRAGADDSTIQGRR